MPPSRPPSSHERPRRMLQSFARQTGDLTGDYEGFEKLEAVLNTKMSPDRNIVEFITYFNRLISNPALPSMPGWYQTSLFLRTLPPHPLSAARFYLAKHPEATLAQIYQHLQFIEKTAAFAKRLSRKRAREEVTESSWQTVPHFEFDCPPLPIDSPLPSGPRQSYNPTFEDAPLVPDFDGDDLDIDTDFVPSRPSLENLVIGTPDRKVRVTSEAEREAVMGIIGLGIGAM
ncbi:hypothetical protein P7C73_g2413, partial [Tremellales sp. Uapishka_1]